MDFIIPLLSFAGAVTGALVFSFVREKGKNLATKTDIGKITETVESIKSNYSKEQEKLKAQLNLLVNVQNSIHGDVKQAIYEFWDNMTQMICLCDTTRAETDEERVNELSHFKKEIERVSNALQLKQARLYLLVEDKELIELSETLFTNVTKYEGRFMLFLIKVEPLLVKMNELLKQEPHNEEIYNLNWKKVRELEDACDKELDELHDVMDNDMEQYKKRALQLLTGSKPVF